MKREFRSLVYVLALGVSMTALSWGGAAGCGSSGGGGTVTADEGEAALATSLAGIGDAFSDDPAGLVVSGSLKGQSGEADCIGGGSVTVGETSATFDNCQDEEGNSIDGTISVSYTADEEGNLETVTLTLNDLSLESVDCGSASIDGTITVDSDSIILDITATVNGTSVTLDCDVAFNATCPQFADACGFSEDVCDDDEFASDICE